MKLVGLMVCRNSDWVIGFSLRAALKWCDLVILMMHNCTDDIGRIAAEVERESGYRVVCLLDDSVEWEEMRIRQTMLETAREALLHPATHIALIDDDEVLTGNLLPKIREHVERIPEGAVLMLPWLQLRNNDSRRGDDTCGGLSEEMAETGVMSSGIWANQNASVAFKDNPLFHWAARKGYDFHHRNPMGLEVQPIFPLQSRDAGLMHLQFLSRRRLIAKQFLYQLWEMKRWPGRKQPYEVAAMYSRTVTESDEAQLSSIPGSWLAPYSDFLQYLHIDAEPWQEAECKRLLTENPGLAVGLNDFGLRAAWEL